MEKIHFRSQKDDWGTPQKLYDELNSEFHFTVDACADQDNFKDKNYYTVETDGLNADWGGKQCFATHLIANVKRISRGRKIGSKKHTKKAKKMVQQ